MGNFWIRESGLNTLKGVEGESDNRPILPDLLIVNMLNENQQARDDFEKLFPTMTATEQERLLELFSYSRPPLEYPQVIEDRVQKKLNNLVVRSASNLPRTVNRSDNSYSGPVVRLRTPPQRRG
jgi:hypothetical protein